MRRWLLIAGLALAAGVAVAQDGQTADPAADEGLGPAPPKAPDPVEDAPGPTDEANGAIDAEPVDDTPAPTDEVPDAIDEAPDAIDEAPDAAAAEPRVRAVVPEPTIEPGDPAFVGPAQIGAPRLDFGEAMPDPPLVQRVPPGAPAPAPAPVSEPPILPIGGSTPDPATDPTPSISTVIEALDGASRALVPRIVLRGVGWGLTLLLLGALTWLIARAVQPIRDRLAPSGVLPTLASGAQHTFRIIALFLFFGALAAIVPRNLEPALPIIVLAAAVAIGWSWRDLLPDLVAGLVIAAERKIVPGQWIATARASGIVEQTTLRVTRIRDATGRQIALPNRTLLRDAVVTDRGRWPTVEIELLVPGPHPPSAVRRVIEDAVLVSPWAAPVPAQMIREEREPGRWRVRARILESRFADRFEGGLREHVEEVLDRGSRLRG